jgi:hypothetical protein
VNKATGPKRIRRRVGDVVVIPLGESNATAYAVVLDDGNFAIFGAKDGAPVEVALQRKPMFYVAVMDSAVKSGRWPIIDVPPGTVPQLQAPPTFIQDDKNPEKLEIYREGKIEPATRDEVLGLERTAGWAAEHVEDRVRDEYVGRKNKWLESLRLVE